jgi:hypothetical protein
MFWGCLGTGPCLAARLGASCGLWQLWNARGEGCDDAPLLSVPLIGFGQTLTQVGYLRICAL